METHLEGQVLRTRQLEEEMVGMERKQASDTCKAESQGGR
jgi:hypothetical protein